jgi:hypothetical protein
VNAIKNIVGTLSHERTEEDLDKLSGLLAHFKEFKEGGTWTVQTKMNLCRCVTFKTYPPETTIFNQGDHADAFYMLLKGTVNVRIKGKMKATAPDAENLTGERKNSFIETTDCQIVLFFFFFFFLSAQQLQEENPKWTKHYHFESVQNYSFIHMTLFFFFFVPDRHT